MERNPDIHPGNYLRDATPVREAVLFRGRQVGRALRAPLPGVFGLAEEIVVRDSTGERHYSRASLDTLLGRYAGRTVTVRQVTDEARLGTVDLAIDANQPLAAYGVRDLLLAAVAMGKARMDATWAEPFFTLEPWREA